jgi:hypothetical protein
LNKKLDFQEIELQELNCGWCMGAGVIAGAGATVGIALLIT